MDLLEKKGLNEKMINILEDEEKRRYSVNSKDSYENIVSGLPIFKPRPPGVSKINIAEVE
jgi:hypothetical protein